MRPRNLYARLDRLERALPPPRDPEADARFIRNLAIIYGKGTADERAAAAERAIAGGVTVDDVLAAAARVYDEDDRPEPG